jgi:DNA-binding LacI/PurR family transcriptional regulator
LKSKGMTFKDVAKAAGVSFATVSRVATNGARVSPEVAKRVTEAAQKLGVDLQRKAKTKVIGFMLSNRQILHSFHSLLLAGAEAYCTEHDYNTLFLPIHYGPKVQGVSYSYRKSCCATISFMGSFLPVRTRKICSIA